MKILCVCHAGHVRSVTLAAILKADHGMDAISAGVWGNNHATIDMLCAWADRIYPVNTDECLTELPPQWTHKVTVFPIGPDSYGHPWHPELVQKIRRLLREDPAWLAPMAALPDEVESP